MFQLVFFLNWFIGLDMYNPKYQLRKICFNFSNLLSGVFWGVFGGMLVVFCKDLGAKNGLRK